MKFAVLCSGLLLLWSATVAQSQVVVDQAATAGESYARGMSGVISAQGQKNLSDSQAAINMTEARSSQIDNQVKSVNAYWEKKGIYSQHLQAYNEKIDAERARYIARQGSLDFSTKEFDRTTGQINWPKVLEQEPYEPYRKKIDELFHKRSYDGALSGDEYVEATTALSDWRAMILKQKDEYPGPILDQMLRFQLKVRRELDDNLS